MANKVAKVNRGKFSLKELRRVELRDYGYQYVIIFSYVYKGTDEEILDLENYHAVSVMNADRICVDSKGMVKSVFKTLGLNSIDYYCRIYEESDSGIRLVMPTVRDMSIEEFMEIS